MKQQFYHAIEFPENHYASIHKQWTLRHHQYYSPKKKLYLDAEFYVTTPPHSAIPCDISTENTSDNIY